MAHIEKLRPIDRLAAATRVLFDERVLEQRRAIEALEIELQHAELLRRIERDFRAYETTVVFTFAHHDDTVHIAAYNMAISSQDFRFVLVNRQVAPTWLSETGVLHPMELHILNMYRRVRPFGELIYHNLDRWVRTASRVRILNSPTNKVTEAYGRTSNGRIDRVEAPPETLEIDIPEFVEGNDDDSNRGRMMKDRNTGEFFDAADMFAEVDMVEGDDESDGGDA